jgi:hypothetical protein
VKDSQSDPAEGRTHWRRFALAAGIPTVVAVGLIGGVASGALAASFSISSQQFKLSADKLEGTGFSQYAGQLHQKASGKDIPAAMSGIKSAKIYNLCQTVAAGPVVLRIEAGQDADNPVQAEDLLIGMNDLSGDATFKGIDIGQDASDLKKGGDAAHGEVGAFGQQADSVTIDGLHQTAYMTSASTFKLAGMHLHLYIGDGKECF